MILAGGAIGSPHILQLSGVGDPDHLGRIGVPVVHALPGVGEQLAGPFPGPRHRRGHAAAPTANEKSRGLPFVGEVMRYVFAGTGLLTYAASLVAASVKVLEESATPDVQILFANGSFAPGPIAPARRQARHDRRHVADAAASRRLCRGASRRDPHEPPAINPRYLSDETDRRAAIGGLRAVAQHVRRAGAGAIRRRARSCPGKDVQSDDELLHYVRQTG